MAVKFSKIACMVAAIVALATPAFGATWKPSHPVRLIVAAQGGTIDLLARLVQPGLQQALGDPVVVEQRPGAGGNMAADLVAKSAPDGSTILVAFAAPSTVTPLCQGPLSYDPLKDLMPITLAITTSFFLTINPDVPAHNVREFVAYAKAHPGKLNFGSVSVGSASQLSMEMLKAAAGSLWSICHSGGGPSGHGAARPAKNPSGRWSRVICPI